MSKKTVKQTPAVTTTPPEQIQLDAETGLRLVVSVTKIALGNSRTEALKERYARVKTEAEHQLADINKQVAEELRMTGEEQGILEELHQMIESKHGISMKDYMLLGDSVLSRKAPIGRG